MNIKISRRGTSLTAHLTGELDQHEAGKVRTALELSLRRETVRQFVFDLSALSFMDSSGIGVIIGIYKMVDALGGEVSIVCGEGSIRKMVELSGIGRFVRIHETEGEALKGGSGA